MKYKQIIILMILIIFTTGMLIGAASASHTLKSGKYKVTVSDKTYNQIKKGDKYFVKKVGTKKVKVQKYKIKKVTKYKWQYKNVLDSEDIWSSDWSDFTTKDYKTYDKYVNKGWTWYGSYYKNYDNGHHVKYFYKFKKKVKVTEKKKVKNGYKTVKKPVYLTASAVFKGDYETAKPTGKVHVEVTTTPYLAY